jgi:outer membrane protein OmpA-like peptidoglycan-associated protein
MTAARTASAAAAVLTAVLLTGCGPRTVATTPRPPSGDLVVLLPDQGSGAVGRVTVSNPAGSVTLDSARLATEIPSSGGPPAAPTVMDEAEVRRIFGEALSALPPPASLFTLYFEFESNQLTAESRKLLPEILALVVKARPAPEVIVIGHTDTTGSAPTNLALGLKRAQTVKQMLVDTGIEADLVEVTSHGEGDPLVQTPDNTPEPKNRRVDIAVR